MSYMVGGQNHYHKNSEVTLIPGIDHGYGNIKTANKTFGTGVSPRPYQREDIAVESVSDINDSLCWLFSRGIFDFELNNRQRYDKINENLHGGVRMGAMLVGMITGGIAWICFITLNIVLAAVIFIDAYRHKMKAVRWAVMALLFSFYAVPVYIIVRIKIARLKCGSCGAKVKNGDCFCTACGNSVKKFDDGTIAKKIILYVLAAGAAISVLGTLYVALTAVLFP